MSFRSNAKRPLLQATARPIETRDLQAAAASAIVYDVVDYRGGLFGFCVQASSGVHVYVEPEQLLGVEVNRPMAVSRTANTIRLATVLGSQLTIELGR